MLDTIVKEAFFLDRYFRGVLSGQDPWEYADEVLDAFEMDSTDLLDGIVERTKLASMDVGEIESKYKIDMKLTDGKFFFDSIKDAGRLRKYPGSIHPITVKSYSFALGMHVQDKYVNPAKKCYGYTEAPLSPEKGTIPEQRVSILIVNERSEMHELKHAIDYLIIPGSQKALRETSARLYSELVLRDDFDSILLNDFYDEKRDTKRRYKRIKPKIETQMATILNITNEFHLLAQSLNDAEVGMMKAFEYHGSPLDVINNKNIAQAILSYVVISSPFGELKQRLEGIAQGTDLVKQNLYLDSKLGPRSFFID